MMLNDLKSFVSSEECLSCRGCCVFPESSGPWCPHLTADEVQLFSKSSTAEAVLSGCLSTVPAGQEHRCVFLKIPDYRCGVYSDRPAECRLYPFLISKKDEQLFLYAHTGCPAVQKRLHTDDGRAYTKYLQGVLSDEYVRGHLRRNENVFPNYAPFEDELEPLFPVSNVALLSRREEIESRLNFRRQTLSGMSFIDLFLWQDFFDYRFEEIAGNLCVFASQPVGSFLYWPPLGKSLSLAAVEECFERMGALNNGSGLTRIERISKEDLASFSDSRFETKLQAEEYVYSRPNIVNLAGHAFKSKRHDIHLCLRSFHPEYRPFTTEDIPGCLDLFERWLDKRRGQHEDDLYRRLLEENRVVHRLAMDYADRLGLVGRVVLAEGKVVAYTFGYPLDDDVFCDLFEVTDPEIPGLPAFIFREFCADEALRAFPWINAMDDCGMPNMRRAKLSWRPVRLEPVYSVALKKSVGIAHQYTEIGAMRE